MRLLITSVKTSIKGGEIRKDRSVDCAEITLGRGTDQILQVNDFRAALAHARLIAVSDTELGLQSLSPAGVLLNGKRVQSATLSTGDRLQLGRQQFTVVAAPDGYDYAFEHREFDPQAETATGHGVTDKRVIPSLKIGRRSLSWLAFLLILTFGLGLPLLSFYQPEARDAMQANAVPGDRFWLSGELSAAHRHFGQDCKICHQQAFAPAPDSVCLECHENTAAHAGAGPVHTEGVHTEGAHTALAAQQCENCHREHNGRQLVPARQRFCTDCHRDHSTMEELLAGADTDLQPAGDFLTEHPQFKASLMQRNTRGEVSVVRLDVDDPALLEQSFLKFPHDVHLDPEGLESVHGTEVLQCADCHQPDAAGQYMQPIRFDTHCVDCHQLNFDPSHPDRVVPHGRPAEVVDVMTEFYAELALRGASREVGIASLGPTEIDTGDPGQVLLWARTQALRTAEALFEGRACGDCHQVTRTDAENRVSWAVEPARVAGIWFPKSRFDHASHQSVNCGDCHAADVSDDSADVLLPGIETCRDCHGGERAEAKVASSCISCHRFHNPATPPPAGVMPQRATLYLWDKPDIERTIQQQQPAETRRRRPGQRG